MGLILSQSHQDAIRRHGEDVYPDECCGFLIGRGNGDEKEVADTMRADNRRTDSSRNRYLIAPEDYLRAEIEAQRRSLEVVGFYHSHPDAEAQPSEFDRKNALPWCSYVIVSVRKGKAESLSSWVLAEDYKRFLPERIAVGGKDVGKDSHPDRA